MKIRPLHDRILVKRIEEENKTEGGLFIPDTAKEKPHRGAGRRRRQRQGPRGRHASQARRQGGRQDPVRQVLRHRDQDRRRRAPHPARGRRPRGDRITDSQPTERTETRIMAAKEIIFAQSARQQHRERAQHPRQRGEGDARAARPQRRHREVAGARPTVTKDGVTVAKEIELEDKFENMGAQMVKEVASKTSDIAGDGTTTATVLAQAIYREGAKLVAAGHNPMEHQARHRRRRSRRSSTTLKKLSKPTKGKKEIAQVGTISANGDDRPSASIIAEAMEKVGKEGVITVEEAKSLETDARRGRGHAVRPRLPVAVLRDRRRAHGGRARGRRTSSSTRRRSRT